MLLQLLAPSDMKSLLLLLLLLMLMMLLLLLLFSYLTWCMTSTMQQASSPKCAPAGPTSAR